MMIIRVNWIWEFSIQCDLILERKYTQSAPPCLIWKTPPPDVTPLQQHSHFVSFSQKLKTKLFYGDKSNPLFYLCSFNYLCGDLALRHWDEVSCQNKINDGWFSTLSKSAVLFS